MRAERPGTLTFAQVITSYNQRDSLARAIESVLAQSVQPDEIAIGDDGSTDGSAELIRSYAERDPDRIRALLAPANRGIAANLNRCIRATRADFVSVLAGDDYLLPGKLAAQYECARRHFPDCEVVYSDCLLEDATGRRWLWSNQGREGRVFAELARRRFQMRNHLFSRRLFDAIGGFDEGLELYEDWKMKLELSLHTHVKYCAGVYSVYAQSPRGAHARPKAVHRPCIEKIERDLGERYALSAQERRYLHATRRHFDFMAGGRLRARLRSALAAYVADPRWLRHHARLLLRALRRAAAEPR